MSERISIPSITDLESAVFKRECPAPGPLAVSTASDVAADGILLEDAARAFLCSVTDSTRRDWILEQHWKACDVTSGGRKERILDQLRGLGFIRLEVKKVGKTVYVYEAGWAYLGLKRPAGSGTGGASHQKLARYAVEVFKARSYDAHIEFSVGSGLRRKRVDVAAFGPVRVGVEIALSRVEQELKNLRDDLASESLDKVLVVATDRGMLHSICRGIAADPYLLKRRSRIVLSLVKGDVL